MLPTDKVLLGRHFSRTIEEDFVSLFGMSRITGYGIDNGGTLGCIPIRSLCPAPYISKDSLCPGVGVYFLPDTRYFNRIEQKGGMLV